jgi:hypothetical protein
VDVDVDGVVVVDGFFTNRHVQVHVGGPPLSPPSRLGE